MVKVCSSLGAMTTVSATKLARLEAKRENMNSRSWCASEALFVAPSCSFSGLYTGSQLALGPSCNTGMPCKP